MDTDNRKGERTVNVTDRPVELQGMVQTVLTFLLLGVMSWVGINLEKVKDNTANNQTAIKLITQQMEHIAYRHEESVTRIERDFKEHVNNPRAHQ